MGWKTASCFIRLATTKFIARVYKWRNRVRSHGRHERLEPCAWKHACTVLRGGDGGTAIPLTQPWKKGDRYGTLLIDHELHAVVDVLPDREAETLAKWLEEHPGVEVINRDRAGAYAEGARKGAPQAMQTADRFHLLLNLQEHVTHVFERKHESLQQIAAEARLSVTPSVESSPTETTQEVPLPSLPHQEKPGKGGDEKPLTTTAAHQLARRTKRQNRYEEVMKLYRQGVSQSAIAELIGLHRDTVHRYVTAPAFPEMAHRKRGSKLDPYKAYLQQRWEQGQQNTKQLIEEIRAKGYLGGGSIVYEHLQKSHPQPEWVETYQQCKKQKALGKQVTPLSARQAAWLFVCNPRKLKFRQVWALEPLRLHDDELGHAYQLAQDFRTMVTQHKVELLEPWLKEVRESQIPELGSLANGILRDYDAVRAALSTHYSNGQTEAQVHRLKLIKRQAYGRASFDQLRLRVLHGSGVTYQEKLRIEHFLSKSAYEPVPIRILHKLLPIWL
jgi:transposase